MANLKILRLNNEMFISSESVMLEANSFIEEIDKIIATERDMLRRASFEGMKEGILMLSKDIDERSYEAFCNSEIEILGYGDGSTKLLKLKVDNDAI
jgi:hypothetical protein